MKCRIGSGSRFLMHGSGSATLVVGRLCRSLLRPFLNHDRGTSNRPAVETKQPPRNHLPTLRTVMISIIDGRCRYVALVWTERNRPVFETKQSALINSSSRFFENACSVKKVMVQKTLRTWEGKYFFFNFTTRRCKRMP